jgi:hypothetical protein
LKHYYLLTNLQSNNKNISTKLDFEISKRQDEFKKLIRISNNQYLDFSGVFSFLGHKLASTQAFSHSCLPIPNIFGQVMHFYKSICVDLT